MKKRLLNLGFGVVVATALVAWAEVGLNASVCAVQCSCRELSCGGDECECSAWESAWFACWGGAGCEQTCGAPFPSTNRVCCSDVCPPG
jgi:hypothetical protein